EPLDPPTPATDTTPSHQRDQPSLTTQSPPTSVSLDSLIAMLESQRDEIKQLQQQSAEKSRALPTRSTESEAKDLLRKVKFNGKYFSAFKIKFQNICQLRHIWDVILGTELPPSTNSTEDEILEYEDKVNLAKSYLQTSLSNDVFDMIREDDTPAEMWKTLIVNFETREWSDTIYVLRRLCNLRYEPKMDMLKHIGKVRATIRELNDMGKTISEHETVEWILISLPDSGPDNYTSFINHLKPTPQHEIKLKTLISALLNEEEKRNEWQRTRRIDRPRDGDIKRKRQIDDNGITSEINALQLKVRDLTERSKTSGDGKWCFICRRRSNHVAQDHTDFDPNYSKANVRQVTKQPAKPKSYKKSRETESSESEDGPSYDINAISDESSNIPLDGGKEQHWTLDNCATGHVTGVKEFVSTWHGPARLILPDKSEIYGQVGVAKIKLLENGRTTTINLNNVTYKPSLYKNLISHCRLLESGYRLVCQDNTETIYKNIHTNHELQFEMKNNLYVLKNVVTQRQTRSRSIHHVLGQSVNIHAITSEQPNDDKLIAWHNKLNHTDMNQVAKIIKPIMNPKQDNKSMPWVRTRTSQTHILSQHPPLRGSNSSAKSQR
ncbi:hypothetical protein AeNC1_018132, partial [Aphanomyces euteiches]